jgi:hypothetical protein
MGLVPDVLMLDHLMLDVFGAEVPGLTVPARYMPRPAALGPPGPFLELVVDLREHR